MLKKIKEKLGIGNEKATDNVGQENKAKKSQSKVTKEKYTADSKVDKSPSSKIVISHFQVEDGKPIKEEISIRKMEAKSSNLEWIDMGIEDYFECNNVLYASSTYQLTRSTNAPIKYFAIPTAIFHRLFKLRVSK